MRLLLRRLSFYVIAAWVALTISFFLPRVMPGNPVQEAISRATQSGVCNLECVNAIRLELGFGVHTSIWVQYLQFWGNLFHGDLGSSWTQGNQPVATLIAQYLPWTIGLLGAATVISFVLGTLIGIVMGWLRGSWLDWLMPVATLFQAIPYFLLALVLTMFFGETAHMLHLLPSSGGYDVYTVAPGMNWPYLWSIVTHAVLPAATVVLASMAGFILGMRNQMITTMDEDFVLVARAKGLPRRRVVWYAARNAMLPSVSNFSIAISLVVAGQLLVELVFNYPGIGYHLFKAVEDLDYVLVQGIFLVIVVVVLVANLLADLVYVLIDPRARQEAAG
jgi:peptide/nickel transport system permease protein